MRPRHVSLLLACVLAAGPALRPSAAGAQEVAVEGFHGYAWGTHGAGIPEIAGAPRVGSKDGLAIHSAELTFLGRRVLAGFYLHPGTGELVEGAYVFHVDLEECQETWERVLETLRREYPRLPVEEDRTRRSPADRQVYGSDCEEYVFTHRPDLGEWRAELVGDDPARGRVLVRLTPVGRVARMTVLYQGAEAHAWAERDATAGRG